MYVDKAQLNAILKQLVAIHLTDYFPQNGVIRTRYSTNPLTWLRDTVHFSLNAPAPDLSAFSTPNMTRASWSKQKFAILIPFDRLYAQTGAQLQGIAQRDTYFRGNVTIPSGSVILVMGSAVADALHNSITIQDEILHNFGDMGSSPVAKKDTPFYVKKVKGIEYRIYNYWVDWNLKDLVTEVVGELGFPTDLGGLRWRELNDALGLSFQQHSDHWTAEMENFGSNTKYMEETVQYIFIFLKRLKSKGVTLPLVSKWGGLNFALYHDEELTDSKGRTFQSKALYSDFSREELFAGKILLYSINDDSNIRLKLQHPIRFGVRLLQEVPLEYHKIIKTYLRSYQAKIKKQLPKGIITLCPGLSELVEQNF